MIKGQSAEPSGLVLTDHDVERRKAFVGLDRADIERIRSLKDLLERNVDDYVTVFFRALEKIEEAAPLFANAAVLADAKSRKREHFLALTAGEYDIAYAEQRIALGTLYSRARLDVRVFLGAYHQLMKAIGAAIMAQFGHDPADAFQRFSALKKICFFDIGIIVDVLIAERERTIAAQQAVIREFSERTIEAQKTAIRELSTPVLSLREHLLILPMIGVVDSERARQLTDELLRAVRDNRAKAVVMDITGVAAVDSRVAQHLTQAVEACRLMGASVIVTGISAAVAQTLATIGVDVAAFNSVGDLQRGVEKAERLLGYRITRVGEDAPIIADDRDRLTASAH